MSSEDTTIRFRPGKKRKVYRQRDDSPPTAEANDQASAAALPRDNASDDERATTAAALRLRNARKARTGGVGFSAAGTKASDDATSTALVPARDGETAVVQGGITNRFTHQTGLVSSLNDKHMTEYIESRLTRRSEPSQTADQTTTTTPSSQHTAIATAAASSSTLDPTIEQPTRNGRLMEVDLSEVPVRRKPQQDSQMAPAPKKVRLGPDGKPWRGRKRRASDDVKRDELVEAFLHENRLDVYDTNQPPDANTAASGTDNREDDATTADDRLAEQFQRQYMDDMARRRQRKKPAQPATGPGAAPTEDVLKGPKLGGSRNARAAVRDALLKKEKEGRK